MTRVFRETEQFYIRSMGKLLRVTALATSDDEANQLMEKDSNAAVVACCGDLVFMANKWDKGE